jgi:hypothetical protein
MYWACSWALHQALRASAKLLSTPRSSGEKNCKNKQMVQRDENRENDIMGGDKDINTALWTRMDNLSSRRICFRSDPDSDYKKRISFF